jgi:plastocyanin
MALRVEGGLTDVTSMKRRLFAAILMLSMLAGGLCAQEKFSEAVRPEDFSAAGLAKLSAQERTRLDVLVEAFKSGALATARREAEAAAVARIAAEARATQAERAVEQAKAETKQAKQAEAGFLAKAKVMLTPGTEVEYLAVESRIRGTFSGWEGRQIFTLENGQRWQLANPDSYYTPEMEGPKVLITPAALGGFWMSFPELRKKLRVKPL